MDQRSGEGHRLQASLFPMSAVRGRHPDDLNEGIPDHFDGAHPSASKHAFEWWYFDGRFGDGHTFAGTIQGHHPYEGTFRHFLKPPKLGRLHGLG